MTYAEGELKTIEAKANLGLKEAHGLGLQGQLVVDANLRNHSDRNKACSIKQLKKMNPTILTT